VKPNINSIEKVCPQLSNNKHLVDGALMGAALKKPVAFIKAHVKINVSWLLNFHMVINSVINNLRPINSFDFKNITNFRLIIACY